jgi:hypothetical protein
MSHKIRNTLNQKLVISLLDIDQATKKVKVDPKTKKEIERNIDLLAKDTTEVTDEEFKSPHLKTLIAREIIEEIKKKITEPVDSSEPVEISEPEAVSGSEAGYEPEPGSEPVAGFEPVEGSETKEDLLKYTNIELNKIAEKLGIIVRNKSKTKIAEEIIEIRKKAAE